MNSRVLVVETRHCWLCVHSPSCLLGACDILLRLRKISFSALPVTIAWKRVQLQDHLPPCPRILRTEYR